MIDVSIIMASWNKGHVLRHVLESIYDQRPPLRYEVIIVDDGSTDNTRDVCLRFPVRYQYINRPSNAYRNPAVARNTGYRMASGNIFICQSSDVQHGTSDCIEKLATRLRPKTCTIARVLSKFEDGTTGMDYCGLRTKRIIFFLGAIWKSTIYLLGGQDEDFIEPCYEDTWMRTCLARHGFIADFCWDVIAYHFDHPLPNMSNSSRDTYRRKIRLARKGLHHWGSKTGPWEER